MRRGDEATGRIVETAELAARVKKAAEDEATARVVHRLQEIASALPTALDTWENVALFALGQLLVAEALTAAPECSREGMAMTLGMSAEMVREAGRRLALGLEPLVREADDTPTDDPSPRIVTGEGE